jgi:Uma2 family endonuclease
VVHRLSVALELYIRHEPVGALLTAPADISWGREDVLVQPDVFVVRTEEARTLEWSRMRGLLLAVEVLSPSSQRADRFAKRKRYQDASVPLYWVVDADERVVEIWTPADQFPSFERERLVWHPNGAVEPFTLQLDELFRPV